MKGSSIPRNANQTGDRVKVAVTSREPQGATLWSATSANPSADGVTVQNWQPAAEATAVQCISPQRLADHQVRASLNAAAMTAPVLLMVVASPAGRSGLNGSTRHRAATTSSRNTNANMLRRNGALVASMAAGSPALALSLESVTPTPRRAREMPAAALAPPAPAPSRQFERLSGQDRIFDGRDQQIEVDSGSGRFGVSFAVGESSQFWVEPQGSEPLATEHFQSESGARRVFYYDADSMPAGLTGLEFGVMRRDRSDETVRLSALVL